MVSHHSQYVRFRPGEHLALNKQVSSSIFALSDEILNEMVHININLNISISLTKP